MAGHLVKGDVGCLVQSLSPRRPPRHSRYRSLTSTNTISTPCCLRTLIVGIIFRFSTNLCRRGGDLVSLELKESSSS